MKQIKILTAGLVCAALLACNGGSSNSSSPATPNTQNELQKYLSLWSYTPLTANKPNKSLSTTIANQLYMVESKDNSVTSMSLTFYSDSACTTALNTITFNGPTSVPAGIYHTTDQSNFYACDTMYSGGCAAELSANSSQYKYTFANGAFSYSYCLTNPATSGDKIADWSSGSAVACSAGSGCGYSQPYTFALFPAVYWAKQVGATSGTTQGNAVAVDTLGNSYIAGYTTQGISGQTQTGTNDYFIAKYSESGLLLWTKQVGAASGSTYGYGVTVDTQGNSYIAGYTTKGISGQTQTGNSDYFIAKYNESGLLLWSKQVGAATGTTRGNGVAVDTLGNSYIAGYTSRAISGQTQTGTNDYFIAKYSESGTLLWTKQVGTTIGMTRANGITVDALNNSYIIGYTTQGISGQTQTGTQDYFIAKYSESGLLLWTKQVGATTGVTQGKGITTDTTGNPYITGYTNQGISGQTQTGSSDYFIAKYNTSGTLLWTKQVGATSGTTQGTSIAMYGTGNPYITGYTTKGISGQTQTGTQDYFIAKYSESGLLSWTKQVGAASGSTYGNAIAVDTLGNPYIAGYTNKGILGNSQTGTNDYILVKYYWN